MSKEIENLAPKSLWKNFTALNAVPRGSKKEEGVITFMQDFGKKLGLETQTDAVGNVLIKKPATSGMEDRKMIVLQSHLDMVHQKNNDTNFDFDKEGIKMYIDGDWVKADGTTLGADNGIGVATMMTLLESSDIQHPAIEALFTIDEETGMTGAFGLQPGFLEGEILLNLDTEDDDELTIGCAGGVNVNAEKKYKEVEVPTDYESYELTIKGLSGGHSGMEIHKGLGNANKLMNRLIYQLVESIEIGVQQIEGGGLRNAIPRESNAVVAIPKSAKKQFERNLLFRFERL
jgi:dipeptidase D